MAKKAVWLGPGILLEIDPDGFYPSDGAPLRGLRSELPVRVDGAPVAPTDVLRLMDVDPMATRRLYLQVADIYHPAQELAKYNGDDAGVLVVWQEAEDALHARLYAQYLYDPTFTGSGFEPYRCPAKLRGMWIGSGPYIQCGGLNLEGNLFPSNDDAYYLGFESGRWRAFLSQCRVSQTPVEATDAVRKQELDAVLGELAALAAALALLTNGAGIMRRVPVVNLADPAPELATLAGHDEGQLLVAWQSGAPTRFTLYAWDSHGGAANSPHVVAGAAGGAWSAVGGQYGRDLTLAGMLTAASVGAAGAVSGASGNFTGGLTVGGIAALGGNPRVFAYQAGSQLVPADATVTVLFPTKRVDVGNCFNAATGEFTVPAGGGGAYLVSATVAFAAQADGQRDLGIYVNATEWTHRTVLANSTIGTHHEVTGLVAAEAGDKLTIRAHQNAGEALAIVAPAGNPDCNVTLSIVKVA
jgi:hypothetical protein